VDEWTGAPCEHGVPPHVLTHEVGLLHVGSVIQIKHDPQDTLWAQHPATVGDVVGAGLGANVGTMDGAWDAYERCANGSTEKKIENTIVNIVNLTPGKLLGC